MGVFNDDIIGLPEINASAIREAATYVVNKHKSHEEIVEIINNIVHGIYYNAKIGIYPNNGVWVFEGRIFGIPTAYAIGYQSDTTPPPAFQKMIDKTCKDIEYIESVFTQLGFECEYVKTDRDIVNVIRIRIPFNTQSWGSFAEHVYSKTISGDIVPIQLMSSPSQQLLYMDFPF